MASASGMRATYTVPDYVVVAEFFDGGGPVAQANVDTTGKATGFGSLPYPGENAVTAPGLLTFATGVPVPGYPFYVRADHPVTPSAEVKDPSGTYALKATADQGKASGSAVYLFGGESPVSRSSADSTGVLGSDGKLTMTAVGVTRGPLLRQRRAQDQLGAVEVGHDLRTGGGQAGHQDRAPDPGGEGRRPARHHRP